MIRLVATVVNLARRGASVNGREVGRRKFVLQWQLEEPLMTEYQAVLTAATQLPVADQLRLIDELTSRLPDDQTPLSEEWLEELDRRVAEIENGTARLVPWEEVRERMYQRARKGRAD